MKYRTIVADPPWPYEEKGVLPGQARSGITSFLPYPTLSIERIKALPVKQLSVSDVSGQRQDRSVPRDGSTLYLWTTTRFLCEAHDVARAWGFEPNVVLVWCKPPGNASMGGTYAANVEFVVVGRRGSPRPARAGSLTRWFHWPRRMCRDHSRKPEAFYDLVEQVHDGPYLELFARRQRLGWSVWGNEVASDVSLEVSA